MAVVQALNLIEDKFVNAQPMYAQCPDGSPGLQGGGGSKRNKIPRAQQAGALIGTPAKPDSPARQSLASLVEAHILYLNTTVQALLAERALSGADLARNESCLRELRSLAHRAGPGWSLELFGSLASGFGTRGSDVDATFCRADLPGSRPWEAHDAVRFLRGTIVPLLAGVPRLTVAERVFGAKVPILRLRFEGQLDIDLSCQNADALRNTRYLRAYAGIDRRVRDLGVAAKLWASAAGVAGAARGHLSSYTFTLMVVYFMQVHPDVTLPCLPAHAFEAGCAGEMDPEVRELRAAWNCVLSLSELLARFFWFYHSEFVWGQEVASPRQGRRLLARDEAFQLLRGRMAPRLHVEDPFRHERNLNYVLGDAEEECLREAIASAHRAILSRGVPVGLQHTRPTVAPEAPAAAEPAAVPSGGYDTVAPGGRAASPSGDSSTGSTASGSLRAQEGTSPAGSRSRGSSEPAEEELRGSQRVGGGSRSNSKGAAELRGSCSDSKGMAKMPALARWRHFPRAREQDRPHASEGPKAALEPEQRDDERREEDPPRRIAAERAEEPLRQRWMWRHAERAATPEAACERPRGQVLPVSMTVRDIEERIGRTTGGGHAGTDTGGPAAASPARPFAATSTNKIASRVSKACLGHAP